MSIAEHVKTSLQTPDFVVAAYLDDLTDDDFMIRPAEGINHINWQIGHLIAAEHKMIEQICPGSMPSLPENFVETYNGENAGCDDREKLWSKAELMDLMREQRAGTLAAADSLSDDEMLKAAPEALLQIAPTVGAVFSMQGTHWMMHAGQWVFVRRQLGKKAMF